MARNFVQSALESVKHAWNDGGFATQNTAHFALRTGRAFWFQGQTSNTSASGVANQPIGTVQIPSGTADGTAITITNSLIVAATSQIWLQVKGAAGKKLTLDNIVPAAGSCTFTVRTTDAAATSSNCDVWFLILN